MILIASNVVIGTSLQLQRHHEAMDGELWGGGGGEKGGWGQRFKIDAANVMHIDARRVRLLALLIQKGKGVHQNAGKAIQS